MHVPPCRCTCATAGAAGPARATAGVIAGMCAERPFAKQVVPARRAPDQSARPGTPTGRCLAHPAALALAAVARTPSAEYLVLDIETVPDTERWTPARGPARHRAAVPADVGAPHRRDRLPVARSRLPGQAARRDRRAAGEPRLSKPREAGAMRREADRRERALLEDSRGSSGARGRCS